MDKWNDDIGTIHCLRIIFRQIRNDMVRNEYTLRLERIGRGEVGGKALEPSRVVMANS